MIDYSTHTELPQGRAFYIQLLVMIDDAIAECYNKGLHNATDC